jgi:glycosyltransferase involved in cell wall biosynthesis
VNSRPKASVIIPTYNRKNLLSDTLEYLTRQTWTLGHFEVIVVDDGSTDGTKEVATQTLPFPLRYYSQANQGDAAARNLGVQQSLGEILIFLDDDILVHPDYLSYLILEHEHKRNRIVVGTECLWPKEVDPLPVIRSSSEIGDNRPATQPIPFVDVCSNNMSIRRDEYLTVGLMQDLGFLGSSMWCDVDFAYRAYRLGFEFLRSTKAICLHRDYVAESLQRRKNRLREAAYRAVILFQKYPDLIYHLPMFSDKMPVNWRRDSLGLVLRKFTRNLASSNPVMLIMDALAGPLEQRYPSSILFQSLERWIIGASIFKGYRQGLHEFNSITE